MEKYSELILDQIKYFEKKMDNFLIKIYSEFDNLIEEIQNKLINPFCIKYNIGFIKNFYSCNFISLDKKSLYELSNEELKNKYGKEFIKEFEQIQNLLNSFVRMDDCFIGKHLSSFGVVNEK